jgi:hypothetical protein
MGSSLSIFFYLPCLVCDHVLKMGFSSYFLMLYVRRHVPVESAVRVYRRYVQFDYQCSEEFIQYLRSGNTSFNICRSFSVSVSV